MIQVSQLQKQIKGRLILSDISFEIGQGECVALIGPNGAGKTTLMSCLIGDKKVSSGQVSIDGKSPKAIENKSNIAILAQDNFIPEKLKVKELLNFFKKVYSNHLSDQDIRELLGFTPQQENQMADKLSGGQRRLLSFVLCLIGKPKLLFLDEPTAGMDTSTRQRFWQIIDRLKGIGTTIIYSSHYIEEVEHTADRILVLHQGKLLRDTTPFAMRNEGVEKQVTLSSRFEVVVEGLDNIVIMTRSQDKISFKTREIEDVWQELQEKGCRISDIEIQSKSLLDSLFETTKEVD